MCKRCGRPQQAGAGRCAACGGELPDAPLPPAAGATLMERFLSAEFPGGRVLTGEGNRLSFRPGASATPFLFELPNLRRLSLVHRPLYEALALIVVAVALIVVAFVLTPVMPPDEHLLQLLGLLGAAGGVLAYTRRRYTLVLESTGQVETRWGLGTVRRGSSQEQHVRAVWRSLADTVRARGVTVSEPPA